MGKQTYSDQTIDVVMCTYNSNSKLFPLVLKRIRDIIPISRMIVVDKFSEDGTIGQVESVFPDNSMAIQTQANLARARSLGISKVGTEWFVFVDDDALLMPHWFEAMQPYTRDDHVGAVEGGNIRGAYEPKSFVSQAGYQRLPRAKRRISDVRGRDVIRSGLFNLTRGFTINTLIRTKAVRGWTPNPLLGAFEDYDITQHILNGGYLYLTVDSPLCLHLGSSFDKSLPRQWSDWFRKGLWHASNVGYTFIPKDLLMLQVFCRVGGSMARLFRFRDPFAVNYMAWHLALIIGLPTKKYVSPTRIPNRISNQADSSGRSSTEPLSNNLPALLVDRINITLVASAGTLQINHTPVLGRI